MFETPFNHFDSTFNNAQQVLRSANYLRKQQASATENAFLGN